MRSRRRSACSILASAIEQREEFVLPVRFDNTDLDGLHPTVAYLNANSVKPTQLAAMLLKKLNLVPATRQQELQVWRIVRSKDASRAFSGESASFFSGRWNHRGVRAVYCASSLCVAVLETAIHVGLRIPLDFVAVGAKLYLTTPATILLQKDLPENWATSPPPESMKEIGTQWLHSNVSAALITPSQVLPAEQVILLNPMHPDFQTLTIFSEESVDISALHMAQE